MRTVPITTPTCEAPRCGDVAAELVAVHDAADRWPGLAAPDGVVRLVLCPTCAGQVLDAVLEAGATVRAYALA